MREAEVKRTMLLYFIPATLDNQRLLLYLGQKCFLLLSCSNSDELLHEKYQLDSWFSPQQLTEGVDKQVKGEQAELNQ